MRDQLLIDLFTTTTTTKPTLALTVGLLTWIETGIAMQC